ncbi:MAG: glycosyl transferase family 1 [Pseudomonadota bacterium]
MHKPLPRPVYVVLAVFKPNREHLEAQIASLAAQTHPVAQVVAVIADLTSEALVVTLCQKHQVPLDVVVPDAEKRSYKSFEIGIERALERAPETALIALCDQDDVWRADKLAILVHAARPGVALVHSDAEVVDAEGQQIHASMHRLEHRKSSSSLSDMLLRNAVTGMTMAITVPAARAALPFPPQAGLFFHHDLWLALVAKSVGREQFVKQPLVKYRQHDGNVVGALVSPAKEPKIGSSRWQVQWAGKYAIAAYLAKSLSLRAQEIRQHEPVLNSRRLRLLRPYLAPRATGLSLLARAAPLALRGHLDLAWTSAVFGAVQTGRLLWATRWISRGGFMSALCTFDTKLFSLAPGSQPGGAANKPRKARMQAADFADRRTQRRFDVSFSRTGPGRVVLMVPTLNPGEMFAGVATALDIGVGLAERGHNVLFLATDFPIARERVSLEFIRHRAQNPAAVPPGRIEVACGATADTISLRASDRFLATAWWTAHLAQGLLHDFPFDARRFHYLIQDYEPGFYPWGHEYAAAEESYGFDFEPIFNSRPLQQHFAELGLAQSSSPALVFAPSVDVGRYIAVTRHPNRVPKLAVYGRPEVARNLFPVCISALQRFLQSAGIRRGEIELVSVGLAHEDVVFDGGIVLKSLGKIPWDDYAEFLGTVDIGLSLMLSPHPSHPPLEMAAAGARVVTNSFGAKDLGTLSPAISSAQPTAGDVARALQQALQTGPTSLADRRIDMTQLGPPIAQMIDQLANALAGSAAEMAEAV